MLQDPLRVAWARTLDAAPHRPLVVSGPRSASALDVESLARAAGSVLALAPLPAPSPVGIAVRNGAAFLGALLAVLRQGHAPILLDGVTPAAERQRILAGLGTPVCLLCAGAWPEGAEDWTVEIVEGPGPVPAAVQAGTVVKVTSGSTGRPRGVVTTTAALLADDAALTATMGLRDDDRLLAAVPLSHSYGLSSLALPAIARGTTLVVPPGRGPFDPWEAARDSAATVFPTVPAYLDSLLRLSEPPPWPPSLRLVVSAGAPLSPNTARAFRERYGRPVHVFYGASEVGGICYDREGGAGERGTVGTPVEGVEVSVCTTPVGVVEVASPAAALAAIPDPDPRLGGGRFETRDLARWQGGELELCGRADDVINVRGLKVHPGEIQQVLERLEGVDEAVALAVPGGHADTIVRVVVACRSRRLTREQVVSWCRAQLAEHKVPRSVVLVDELPRTERGKVDRAALLAL